jgi:hypothetical protein
MMQARSIGPYRIFSPGQIMASPPELGPARLRKPLQVGAQPRDGTPPSFDLQPRGAFC